MARFVLPATRMMPSLAAALSHVVLEARLLEQRWPDAAERTVIQRALFDVHVGVSVALLELDQRTLDERAAGRLREAFLVTLVLAVSIQRMVSYAHAAVRRTRAQLAAAALHALGRLMDALDPFLARLDVAVRRVMLDGISQHQAAAQIALPV